MASQTSPFSSEQSKPLHTELLFGIVWVALFALYYPAAKAGFVTDFTGWLDQVRNHSSREYVNRSNFHVHSLYQFTQLVTYCWYQLFGTNPWLWHLLFITLHATNVCLLYSFCLRLLNDVNVRDAGAIALAAVALCCISPYMSEVIVWEPSFHFLQGLMLILLILISVQQYVHTGLIKHAWIAGFLYFLSTFSLEVFYLTPWLVLALGLFYRHSRSFNKAIFRQVSGYFFLPMLVLFLIRFVIFYLIYGSWVSRIGTVTVAAVNFHSFGKPIKYLFHLLFVGRFFHYDTRQRIYDLCDSTAGIILFYAVVAFVAGLIITRFKTMSGKAKVASLLFFCVMVSLGLLIPVWFSESLLVLFDRYIYVTSGFFYMLLVVLVSMIRYEAIKTIIFFVFALANLRFAIMVSRYWGKSEKVIHGLLHNLPEAGNKTIILLNLPESLNGVAMIGSGKDSEYKLMHDLLLTGKKIRNTVYDALSYNMSTPADGAHVMVVNDSMIHVTLNQWGTWWWYEGKGGNSYENADYKLNLIDAGHWYELTLKKPADQYLLLYQVGNNWHTVDLSKKGTDQD